jgi:DNA-directed RNA polymerase subunit RPC12/RpoP
MIYEKQMLFHMCCTYMPFLLIENNCNETIKLTNVALTSSSPQNLYICETCGTLFKQKWQLNKHMVTHGELPYICKLCQTKYKTSVALPV